MEHVSHVSALEKNYSIRKKIMNSVRLLLSLLILLTPAVISATQFDNTHLIADANNGDPQAQYTLAHLYLKGKGGIEFDVEEAVMLLESAADSGHQEAAFDLAFLYLNGTKLAKDRVKALHWLTRSAEMGQVDAQYFLGMAYKKNDPEKAAAWLKMASESGHLEAASELNQICRKNPQWCRFTAN